MRNQITHFKDEKDKLEVAEIKLQRKVEEKRRIESMKKAERKKYIAQQKAIQKAVLKLKQK